MVFDKEKALFVLSGGKRHSDVYEYPNSLIGFFDEALWMLSFSAFAFLFVGNLLATFSIAFVLLLWFGFTYLTTVRKRDPKK